MRHLKWWNGRVCYDSSPSRSYLPKVINSTRPSIVETVSAYVALKRAGRELRGLCPFHADKHPSLSISEEKGLFHCFGCNEGGDAISFIMKIEGISFKEALVRLGLSKNFRAAPARGSRSRRAAVEIVEWVRGMSERIHEVLREKGDRIRLAKALYWREEVRRLEREWDLLASIQDDLFSDHILEFWREKEELEKIVYEAR